MVHFSVTALDWRLYVRYLIHWHLLFYRCCSKCVFFFSTYPPSKIIVCIGCVYAASVPDSVKAELLQRIRTFLTSASIWHCYMIGKAVLKSCLHVWGFPYKRSSSALLSEVCLDEILSNNLLMKKSFGFIWNHLLHLWTETVISLGYGA